MAVLREVVFPGLRLIVWAVIAVSLCVLAFGGGDRSGTSSPIQPVAEVAGGVVPVEVGDVLSNIELAGTVAADPSATVKATASGIITRVHRKTGDAVGPDTPLIDIRVTVESPGGAVTAGPDGLPVIAPATTRSRKVTIVAGSEGVLASLPVLKDQEISVGTDVAAVSPGTLSVSAPLTQEQQFRLLSPPPTARAQAPGGPAPFDCLDLRTGAAAAQPANPGGGPAFDPMTGQPLPPATAQVSCRVPAGTTVFAGMSVDLKIDVGSAQQVLVVPTTAVLGGVAEGTVWVLGPDGAAQARPVRLGLSDGTRVQVVEGLSKNDAVLEFAPIEDPESGTGTGPA